MKATKYTSEMRTEIRQMTPDQLRAEIKDQRTTMVRLGTQAVTEKVEDNSQFRKTRKTIARLLTERRARQLAAAPKKRTSTTPSTTTASKR